MNGCVLWDVDGTLLLNARHAGRLYDEAITEVTGFVPEGRQPGEHGKTDGQIVAERLAEYGLDPGLHSAVSDRLNELSREGSSGRYAREVAPGVPEALSAIFTAGWSNAVLTGNSLERARYKFDGAGLDTGQFDWQHSFFGRTALRRGEITAAARAALGQHPAVIIGDTPSDGAAAAEADIPFFAVATGVFSVEDLRATSAALAIADLVEGLPAILRALKPLESR